MSFISNLISGLSLGSIYALIALGYTMVYGIAKMLNFAHGDIIMVGAFAVITFVNTLGFPGIVGVFLSVVVCSLLGITIERIAYKPLRNAPSLSVLITAIGVSYFLEAAAQLIFGVNQKSFPTILQTKAIHIGSLTVKGISVVTMIVAVILMVALTFFINRTKMGKAMRAVSEDRAAAELMGISVNKTITITFAIGSALAAVAGTFYGMTYTFITPYTGAMPGIKAFVAAVIGGVGSIPGAMLGGFLLGIIECLAKRYISTALSDAIVFGVLILVLLVKPTGLLGKKKNEKV